MSKIYDFDPAISSVEDWHKKYNNTVILLNGAPHFCGIEASVTYLSPPIADAAKIILPNSGWDSEIRDKYVLEQWFPQPGWVVISGFLHYIDKAPFRQWQRSYCKGTYKLRNIYKDPTIFGQAIRQGITARHVYMQLYTRQDHLPGLSHDFASKIPEHSSGASLTDSLAVIRFEENTWVLASKYGFVGYIKPSEYTILVAECVYQEVLDYLKEKGIEWKLLLM